MPAFSTESLIRFRDCDPAGILFFGRPFEYAHDAFEDFVTAMGFTTSEWFGSKEFGTPVRHSTCEYAKPMRNGERISIRVHTESIGESSFTLKFLFGDGADKRCEVTLVMVCIDFSTFKKMPLPSRVRERLEAYKI